MALKILCFGEKDFLNSTIAALRSDQCTPADDDIVVDTIDINSKSFLIFSITNPELIPSQATGTDALLYFLSTSSSIYEQKDFLFSVFQEKSEFEGLPVAITYDKEQDLSIKDIVNHFELFKVKDRASMIKEIDRQSIDTIKDLFGWIENQADFKKAKRFDAHPKVIKVKPKYRDSEIESTETKYEKILRQKKMRTAPVKDQETAYIVKEKERMKNENMEKQLAHFNKNKKKMAPYDIKATPNPRIQANLHFFLKDSHTQKGNQANIKIQTDEFKERTTHNQYFQKKTGMNISTQIQPTELFNFDQEVSPILQILTTRALQIAALEIEEEEETLKIIKYKNAFGEKVKKQKSHEESKIKEQQEIIRGKNRCLAEARKKNEEKKRIATKVTTYSFADKFLSNIYGESIMKLNYQNYFPNNFQNQLKTDYLNEIIKKTAASYERILEKETCLQNIFEEPCLKPVSQKANQLKEKQNDIKNKKRKRRVNQSSSERFVHIYYEHPIDKKFVAFSKYLEKQFSGTLEEYFTKRQKQIQDAQYKKHTGEIDENQLLKIKEKDNEEFSSTHKQFIFNSQKNICFTVTSNKFEKSEKQNIFVGGIHAFNYDLQLVKSVFTNEQTECEYLKVVNDLRYFKNMVNMDKGIVIDFAKIPKEIKAFIMVCKFQNIPQFLPQADRKHIKYATYGLEYYDKGIPIHKENIGEKINWEDFMKANQGQNGTFYKGNECLNTVSYLVHRKTPDFWMFEEIRFVQSTIVENNSLFKNKVCSFFKQNHDIVRDDEEPKPKREVSGNKRSKKVIVEESQPKKVQLKMCSRVLKEVQLNLEANFEQNYEKLKGEVENWKEVVEILEDGWELVMNDQKLESNKQIHKFRKVGDIKLRKIQGKCEVTKKNSQTDDQ